MTGIVHRPTMVIKAKPFPDYPVAAQPRYRVAFVKTRRTTPAFPRHQEYELSE
jgi:hypothetical protein